MKKLILCCAVLFLASSSLEAYPVSRNALGRPPSGADTSTEAFLGRWDLSLKSPKGELPSWIEVSEEQGHLKVVMVGLTDHATELKKVDFKNGEIEFFSPKGEEGFREDTLFKGRLADGQLVGTASTPNGASWPWTGRKAPILTRNVAPKWGKPLSLFNGKDFSGWRFSDAGGAKNWAVEDGTLVNHGGGAEIITTSEFEDFKLHLEFQCGPKSNSGVYLRGRYEVQIETDWRRSRPATTLAACTASLPLRRSCRARLEYGKASTLPWSGEQSRLYKTAKL